MAEACAGPAAYRPRHARDSPLYRLAETHHETFKQVYDERFATRYGAWRSVVERTLCAFLDCGIEEHGFARVRCDACRREFRMVLSGAAGSGKTMVVRHLLEKLEEEVFEASMLVVLGDSASSEWLLRRLAVLLGEEEPKEQRDALLAQIIDQLAIVWEDGRHAVLIIDDAQALSSRETLAELGALLKLQYEERRLLSIVLAGVPELETALAAHPVLAPRVDVRVSLAPLDVSGTRAYVSHRLQGA